MIRHRSAVRLWSVVVAGLLAVLLCSGVAVADGPAEVDLTDLDGGNGDPYIITNASELQVMNQSLGSDYELGGTINATNTSDWYAGDGFEPIGNATHPFTGSFDGNGYAIENLTVDRGSENYVGLFGNAGQGTTIGNVTLQNTTINGSAHVGTLVGETDGDVYDVDSGGNVTTELSGGSPTVDGDSDSARVGGLVGLLTESGTVRNSTASVNVTGTNTDTLLRVGGLVGYSFGEVRDSKATGDVEGLNGVGGVVGRNAGHIENVTATGNVTGLSDNVEGTYSVGGLAGYNGPDNSGTGTITLSHATGTVSAVDGNQVGGLIGSNRNTVNKSYATGAVEGTTEVGGLVGHNQLGSIVDSYANGTVVGGNPAGGLVGRNDATIETSYAVVDVPDGEGGFVGSDNGGTVTAGYWDSEATGETDTADGEGLSTFEMTALVAKDYLAFDFETTWNATDRYPRLAWQGVDEPDPYPTAAPGEETVWLLNDSDTGYYHNYSIDSSGDVRWLGEVVASPGSDDSAQLIKIAAGNATEAYDTLVVGPGAYNLSTQQVNLTTDTGANLTRVFSHDGSDETEILRDSTADFTADDEASLRVDNPAAATLIVGENGSFAANGDGGFYIESDAGDSQYSPLVGIYDAASQFNLTVANTDFGMRTDSGETILLNDSNTAFTVDLDVRSHAGAVINASAASTLTIHNSTISETADPQGAGLTVVGISFLTLAADDLTGVTVDNVTVSGASEDTAVEGIVELGSLDPTATVTMDELQIDGTSQDAIRVATDIASLSLSGLNLTDIGTRGLTLTSNVTAVTITDSEVTTTSATAFFTDTTANVSQYNVSGTTITDSGGRGIYLRGDIGNATIENNTLTDSTLTPIDFGVNAGQSTPYEILDNDIDGSGVSNSLIVVGSNAEVNITGNTLLNSGLRGIYLNAADAVIADTHIENSSQDRTDAHGIELDTGATNATITNTTVIDSHDAGIYVFPDNVTIRNATVETTGGHGIEYSSAAADSVLSDSTITNTSDDALAITDVTVPITDLDLGSGTISANVTDTNLNRTVDVASNADFQSGGDAISLPKASGRVENLTLSYNASAFDIDQRALGLWRRDTVWRSEASTVDTAEQAVVATEAFNGEVGVLSTFASNVSVNANDTTVDEGVAGTIELNATNGADGLKTVVLNVSDDGGLDGLSDGDTVTTDANGEAPVSFQESTPGTYDVVFRWTNRTLVSDTATVTVESTGGGGGGGGNTGGGGGGGTPPAPGVEQTVIDNGDTEVTGGRRGDVIALNDETTRDTSSLTGLDNIAVDGLSVELATDRDFFIDVETYERGEEDEVDATAEATGDTADGGATDADGADGESAGSTGSSITASFERETETVSVGYVTVTHNLAPEDIAGATFEFSVRQAYLDELDVDPEDVDLYRQTDQWSSLSTEFQELSQGRYRFEADSPGFSSFAIGTNAPLSVVINGTLDQTEIEAGQTATATATVNNRGQNPVTHTVELTADGETVTTETVTVEGGEIVAVPLAFEPAAGVYEMAVDDVAIGSLTVTGTGSSPWWLLGVVLALLLLAVWWRRREDDASAAKS